MHTLIVYSGKYGFTEKCAKILSSKLVDKVDLLDLKKAEDMDILGYDSVIIGGSIYIGKIHKEVVDFCSKNAEILKEKRIGLFICGMQEGEAINSEINSNFPEGLLNIAVAKEHFGGEFKFDKMNFIEKIIIKKVSKTSSDKSLILKDNICKFAQAMNDIS